MMQLINPNEKYLESNFEYLKELFDAGEMTQKEYEDKVQHRKSISAYLESIQKLDKDNIRLHIYWLVDDRKFIGTFRLNEKLTDELRTRGGNVGYTIRPSENGKGYGTKILELGLKKAKELGMEEVLIDCREDNIASKKIIESNGGVFLEAKKDGDNPKSLHYKISIE